MKKIILGLGILCSLAFSESILLKKGWNLIGPSSEISASSLSSNSDILSATGGGIGGGADFTYNKEYSQYASGNFKLGQGYWIKVENDSTLDYTKSTNIPTSILLRKGWNLINPFSVLIASELVEYPQILSATGGGVGGGANFTYNKKYAQYASGNTITGQGYWFKVSEDMTLSFARFDYRAWGVSGDDISSKATLRINGIEYTVFAYSTLDVLDVSQSPDFIFIQATALDKTIPAIQISTDYNTEEIKLKVFDSQDIFNDTTLIAESDVLVANNDILNYGNITFANPNDYSVPEPENIDGLNPPPSPTF